MDREQGDVVLAVPERGHEDGEHVEAVIEVVGGKRPSSTSFFKSRLVAATIRDIDGAGSFIPHALILPFLEHPQGILLWSEKGISPTSSRNREPAVGGLKPAGAIFDGAGERAFDVAEELAFVKFARHGGRS